MREYSPLYTTLGNTEPVTEVDIIMIEKRIQRFMVLYRDAFAVVPPKLHILEDHVVPQLKAFGHGLGILSEQGGENSHRLMDQYRQRYGIQHIQLIHFSMIIDINTQNAKQKSERIMRS